METLDPDLLRVLVAFAEAGTLARAADSVGRSPSAVTAQIQRLEQLVGRPLLAPAGRGRVLTPAGEDLVGHARRILAAHRDAWLSINGTELAGAIALGCTQDFSERALPGLLRQFARAYPRVRIDLRIGRSTELAQGFASGAIDLTLAVQSNPSAHDVLAWREPMIWLAAAEGVVDVSDQVPLSLLDPPCGFRSAALAALDAVRRPYRIAATSPSLAGLKAAVLSGLSVTPRTPRMLGQGVAQAPQSMKLPPLPEIAFVLKLGPHAGRPARDLADLLAEGLTLPLD